MAVLVVTEPQAFVAVVVGEVVDALTMLLVLEPLALVFLAVLEDIGAVSLALTFVVLAFVHVTDFIYCAAFAVGLSGL